MYHYATILMSGIFFIGALAFLFYSRHGLKTGKFRGYSVNQKTRYRRYQDVPMVYKDKDPKTFYRILKINYMLAVLLAIFGLIALIGYLLI